MLKPNINPADHPAGYVTAGSGLTTAFLVREANFRLGWDITPEEAGVIVAVVATTLHFASGYLGGKKTK